MFEPINLLAAVQFAADKHRLQRRKDSGASAYINHPIDVAMVLAREGGVSDEDLLVAALLHDTVEDTKTTFDELERQFGRAIRNIVAEVTDDKTLDKQARKDLQVAHAPHASAAARHIKIADKICNIRDIGARPPVGWSVDRKLEYLAWAERVVAGCRGVNPRLEAAFDRASAEARS